MVLRVFNCFLPARNLLKKRQRYHPPQLPKTGAQRAIPLQQPCSPATKEGMIEQVAGRAGSSV
jgi:hypothetical protein